MAGSPEEASTTGAASGGGRWHAAGVVGCLALFLWLVGPGLRDNTPTIDEFVNVPVGFAYWRGAPLFVSQNTPPLARLIFASPLLLVDPPPQIDLGLAATARSGRKASALAARFMEANRAQYFECFFRARVVVVGLALLGGLLVFAWARHLFGPGGGLFSLFLYCLSPEILAHGGLATTDMALSVFALAALFFWVLNLERPRISTLVAAALACTAACLTKYSGPILIPVFVLVAALIAPRGRRAVAAATGVLAATATLWLGLLILYGPDQFPTRLTEMPPKSRLVRRIAATPLGSLRLPLPRDYVAGFDSQLKDAEATASYLFGQWGPGRRYYYMVALAVKAPLPILAFLMAPALWWWRRRRELPSRQAAAVIVPAAAYFAVVSASNLQVGLRYVLPAYVLLLVQAGAVPSLMWNHARTWMRATFVVLCGWLLGSVVSARPFFLPYFNEAAGGRTGGDRFLIDSNIDWGQDLGRLGQYLRRRNLTGPVDLAYFGHVDPAFYGIDWRPAPMEPPTPGTRRPLTVVSVNFVHGHAYALDYARPPVEVPPTAYRWLEGYEPIDRVGGSLLVYDLTEERRRTR